jgi:hypothetical protein
MARISITFFKNRKKKLSYFETSLIWTNRWVTLVQISDNLNYRSATANTYIHGSYKMDVTCLFR